MNLIAPHDPELKLYQLVRNPQHRHTAIFANANSMTDVIESAGAFTSVLAFQPDPDKWHGLLRDTRGLGNVKLIPSTPRIDAFGLKACDLIVVTRELDMVLEYAQDTIFKFRPVIVTTRAVAEDSVDGALPADYRWGPVRYGDTVFMLHGEDL